MAGGTLAVAGGLLMLISGYNSRGFLYMALGYSAQEIPGILSGMAADVVTFAVTVLELLVALGGLTVLAGGLIVLARHSTIGRVLIYLGGGAGFLGLLISFGYSAFRLGLDPVLSYLPYWLGLALAVAGRRLAKGT
jgi:hypothetical protein